MDKAQVVLWLGLMMIILQIVKEWPTIRSTLFASGSSGSTGSSGGIPLPPFILPGIPFPLSATAYATPSPVQ